MDDLICLLPVRNGEQLLAKYFDSVRGVCGAVIALDDGSTDGTRAILEAEPLVRAVLSNPPRPSFAGWDDAQNRARLLAACADFAPRWVLWLDVDEAVPDCDAPRLVEFLRDEAKEDVAYGFEILRMIGDAQHYDKHKMWIYRLHSYRPGYTLPTAALHFEPVPNEILRENWKRTRIRILHFSSMTETLRRFRFEKYREADPLNTWQDSYENVLDEPGHIWELRPLPRHKPLLID